MVIRYSLESIKKRKILILFEIAGRDDYVCLNWVRQVRVNNVGLGEMWQYNV